MQSKESHNFALLEIGKGGKLFGFKPGKEIGNGPFKVKNFKFRPDNGVAIALLPLSYFFNILEYALRLAVRQGILGCFKFFGGR